MTDNELLSRLDDLVSAERSSMADVIEHLLEVDRRELALDRGFSSLFEYCVSILKYSPQAAYFRIRAMRAAQRYPEITDRLRDGRIQLDTIARLSPHLTVENHQRLLSQVERATSREVKALVASLQTGPTPRKEIVQPLPGPPADDCPEVIPPPLFRLHFNADGKLMSKVDRLRGLLRHKFPEGKLEDIFSEAAGALIELIERDRSAPARKERGARTAGAPSSQCHGSRFVPKTVKRSVWQRDGGRCSYVSPEGRRCESFDALEYDHIIPWADGGRSDTPDNIRLLCRAHNQRLGRRRFGDRRNP